MHQPLSTYAIGNGVISLKRKPNPLVVFLNQGTNQQTIECDYTEPVAQTMKKIWQAFSLQPKPETEFSVMRLSPSKFKKEA